MPVLASHLYVLFGEVSIEIYKSISFLYANNELTEREIKKTAPFIIATKRIQYLGINPWLFWNISLLSQEEGEGSEGGGGREQWWLLISWSVFEQLFGIFKGLSNRVPHRPSKKFLRFKCYIKE